MSGSVAITAMHLLGGTAVLLSLALPLHGAAEPAGRDPMRYTVPLIGAEESVYSEDESRYRVESSQEIFSLIDAANQRVLSSSFRDGRKTILLAAGDGTAAGAPEEHLYDSPFLNLESPEIRGAAAAIGRTGDILASVESFVKGRITRPTTGIPLLPAARVLSTGSGDCTEHAVLAVALLRRMGVPTRAVVGMVLVREYGGERDVFVYHMWAEAYYRGRWRMVDATVPGERHRNRYIAFAYHSLRTESPLSYLRAVSAIQDLTVTYIR
ncbi:MAG: transglutaminase domain-containing protein [Spirochaetes bacterium]|nr:transglutaminase domain-containing protein [Spirochaetota bacterium]